MNIFTSKWRHLEILTSLFYGKVNYASEPSLREIVVKFSPGKWSQFPSSQTQIDLFAFVTLMNDCKQIKISQIENMIILACVAGGMREPPYFLAGEARKEFGEAASEITGLKHTYLFYGNVNCTSKAKTSDSVRFSSAKWCVDPTTLYPFTFILKLLVNICCLCFLGTLFPAIVSAFPKEITW